MQHTHSFAHYWTEVCTEVDGHHRLVWEAKSAVWRDQRWVASHTRVLSFALNTQHTSHSTSSAVTGYDMLRADDILPSCGTFLHFGENFVLVLRDCQLVPSLMTWNCHENRKMYAPERPTQTRHLFVSLHLNPLQVHQPRIVQNRAVVYYGSSKEARVSKSLNVT